MLKENQKLALKSLPQKNKTFLSFLRSLIGSMNIFLLNPIILAQWYEKTRAIRLKPTIRWRIVWNFVIFFFFSSTNCSLLDILLVETGVWTNPYMWLRYRMPLQFIFTTGITGCIDFFFSFTKTPRDLLSILIFHNIWWSLSKVPWEKYTY